MNRFVWNHFRNHFRNHWRLNGMLLAAFLLASGLLAAMPMIAAIISGQSLSQSLNDALVPVRNIEIESASLTERLTAEHEKALLEEIGSNIREIVRVRDAALDAEQNIYRVDGSRERVFEFLRLRFRSYSTLAESARLIEGRWPSAQVTAPPGEDNSIEIAIGSEAADRMALHIGDHFSVLTQGEPLNSERSHFSVRIVGILEPSDPGAETWWGDSDLEPFSVIREQVTVDLQRINLSVFVTEEVMEAQIPEHRHYWRLFVDRETISVSEADLFRDRILRLDSRLATISATLNSGLPGLIATFGEELSRSQVSLLLLTAQSLFAVLLTLGLISALWVDLTRFELATLVGRGFGGGQITSLFALETLFLALVVAFPLGPITARFVIQLWSRASGAPVLTAFPVASWQLAAVATALGWLGFVVPLYLATRGNLLVWQRSRSRPEQHSRGRRISLDFFLLALGAASYWQFTQIGTAVSQKNGIAVSDPLLLLAPSLLSLAIALLLRRLFPFLIRLLRFLSRHLRGFALPMGFTRLARESAGPGQILLLISLATGLTIFAAVFENSIRVRQQDVARYAVGADLTIRQPREQAAANADLARVTAMPGVVATLPVYRGNTRPAGRSFASLNLLAVDPGSLALVTGYPSSISPVSMSSIAAILRTDDSQSADLPLILSNDAAAGEARLGDRLEFSIGPNEVTFEVTGIIGEFPTLAKPFMITNLAELEKRIDLNSPILRASGERELWLATEPSAHVELAERLGAQSREEVGLATYQAGRLIGDARVQLTRYEADVSARQTITAFSLNALILVIVSSVAFLLIQIFAARRRVVEFAVLRSIGFSATQLARLIGIEGLIILASGLFAGSGIGFGLANLMRPFLSFTLASGLGGLAIDQIVINWSRVGSLLLLQTLSYGIGMFGLIALLMRTRLHLVLRQVEE